jgi:hypothetical protein
LEEESDPKRTFRECAQFVCDDVQISAQLYLDNFTHILVSYCDTGILHINKRPGLRDPTFYESLSVAGS